MVIASSVHRLHCALERGEMARNHAERCGRKQPGRGCPIDCGRVTDHRGNQRWRCVDVRGWHCRDRRNHHGENCGNSIVPSDIAGSAEIQGGEIGCPPEIKVTPPVEPPVAKADRGDIGEATTSADDSSTDDNGSIDNHGNGDVTIINRTGNWGKAKVVEEGRG